MLKEPFLFEGAAVLNPICDLASLFMHDLSSDQLDRQTREAIKEFGNFAKPEDYRAILNLSPYHLPVDPSMRPITDLLICCGDNPSKYHARKMVARIREVFAHDPLFAFYREFGSKMYTDEQIQAEMVSFLINSLLFNK